MSDETPPLVYSGPALGDAVKHMGQDRTVNATRATGEGSFVSFDGGFNYVPVSDLDAQEIPADETLPEESPPAE